MNGAFVRNRSTKSGYRVVAVRIDGAKALGETTLVTGFENNDEVIGRPADVLVMPDGALLVADQLGGAVYRVTYSASGAPSKP